MLEDEVEVEESTVNDAALLPTYNLKQKETFEDVVVNEELDEGEENGSEAVIEGVQTDIF